MKKIYFSILIPILVLIFLWGCISEEEPIDVFRSREIEWGITKVSHSDIQSGFYCGYQSSINIFDEGEEIEMDFYYGTILEYSNIYESIIVFIANDEFDFTTFEQDEQYFYILKDFSKTEFFINEYKCRMIKDSDFYIQSIEYNHLEEVIVPEELFNKDSGIIYFCIRAESRESGVFPGNANMYYKKENGKIYLSDQAPPSE
jgi:hypothetical protein